MTLPAPGPWPASPALRLRRWYAASPADVFRAFTDPGQLRQWWGPRGFTFEEIDFTPREGGQYMVRLRAPDGTRFAHTGTFLKVEPERQLVYSWRWIEGPLDPAETLVELQFVPERGGVTVELCHSRFANQAECDRHVGWHDAFDRLATWVAR